MLIDTHVHYNLEPLDRDWQAHWQKALQSGVRLSVIVGTNLETSEQSLQLSQKESGLFTTVGVHPHDVSGLDEKKLKKLAQNEKVVAIGETGLDFFRLNSNDIQAKNDQKSAFIKQIELANEIDLPMTIHVRDQLSQDPSQDSAYTQTIQIIKQNPIKNNFVLHCVSGPDFYIEEMILLGAYFGFDGNITYKNADQLRNTLKMVPKNKVVIETDAPYLPPEPHRGEVCEPWMISLTAKYLKENFDIDENQLETNSRQLFPLLYLDQIES